MTITYPDGTVAEALLLLRGTNSVCVAVAGDDDARAFSLINNVWISESGERVRIEFAWERRGQSDLPRESECVCSKEMASRLVSMLLAGSDGNDLVEDMLYVYSAEGRHAPTADSRVRKRSFGRAKAVTAIRPS